MENCNYGEDVQKSVDRYQSVWKEGKSQVLEHRDINNRYNWEIKVSLDIQK